MNKILILTSLASVALIMACAPRLAGDWNITAQCPPQNPFGQRAVVATANVEETGQGLFRGVVKNDLGQSGQFDGRIKDDKLHAKVTWEGAGATDALLTFNRASRSFEGQDSNGCSLVVVRP